LQLEWFISPRTRHRCCCQQHSTTTHPHNSPAFRLDRHCRKWCCNEKKVSKNDQDMLLLQLKCTYISHSYIFTEEVHTLLSYTQQPTSFDFIGGLDMHTNNTPKYQTGNSDREW